MPKESPPFWWTSRQSGDSIIVPAEQSIENVLDAFYADRRLREMGLYPEIETVIDEAFGTLVTAFTEGGIFSASGAAFVGNPTVLLNMPNSIQDDLNAAKIDSASKSRWGWLGVQFPDAIEIRNREIVTLVAQGALPYLTITSLGSLIRSVTLDAVGSENTSLPIAVTEYMRRLTASTNLAGIIAPVTLSRLVLKDIITRYGAQQEE